MIIQSSNKPIIVQFSEDVTNFIIRITLWSKTGNKLKEWKKNDLTIEENIVLCPLTQTETTQFPTGESILEIKWLNDDGITEFAKKEKIDIVSRFDTTSMEVVNSD